MAGAEEARDISQLPLIGVTLCCTSIPPEKRSSLSTMASQMGASHKLDLTSDVTHLLVGDVDTPKYKYVARERPDVKCLHHEWVEAVRASWIEGGETDVEALEKEYRLPTFYGLRICVTGFSDITQRKQLEASINDNGAEYLGDLSKDVTHLVAASATGEKYQFAKHWGVKIVAIEWLEQSLDRGMVLEETLYDPQLEVNKRGIGAVAPRPATLRLPTKRRSDNVPEQQLPRKLRRTASAKLNNETAIIWTDIVRAGSGPEGAKQTEWEDSFAENKSINPESSTLLVGLPLADPVQKLHLKDGIFSGKSFYLYGFDDDKSSILRHHLLSHDAEIIPDLSMLSRVPGIAGPASRFIIASHTIPAPDIPSIFSSSNCTFVTDFWVEKCLLAREYIVPSSSITFAPFNFPVPGFGSLVISSTAFEGIELLHISKIVKLLGGRYEGFLSTEIGILVCRDNSLDRDKIRFALEMNIPAVRADWLWDSMKSFRKMPLEDYLIYPSRQGQNAPKRRLRGGSNITTSCETIKESFKPNSKQFESELSNGSLIVEKGQDDITQDVSPVVDDSFSLAEQPELPSLDTLINPLAPDTSSHTSQGNGPLKERSPNSPSKQPTPPLAKASRSPSPSSENTQKTTISEALSSLIAHHSSRAESFNAPSKDSASNANSGKSGDNRRSKRKLFSRVASNLSAKSSHNLSVNVSRASSVDTLNTDGLGSPIDLQPPQPNRSMDITEHLSTAALNGSSTTKGNAMNRLAESLFDPAPYNLDFPEEQVAPPMTQVGYEDPEAKIYRAKLVKKMSGRKKEAKSPEVKVDPEQKLVDSVGKRTRGRPSRA